jgi:hypothetical protein
MDLSYINRVKEWVEIDNKLLRSKNELKDIVDKKKRLEEEILEYVETNKLENLCLNITDGTVKFSKRNQTQSLSIKVIKSMLESYIDKRNKKVDVDDICDFIVTNLEKKTQVFMKRDIKETP